MNLKQNFQNQMAEELFPGNLTEDKACFLRRFAPENRVSTHIKIAKLMKEDLGAYCENKISQTIRKVIEVVHKACEEEMKADGVNTEALLNLKAGGTLKGKEDEESHKKFSPWKEVYEWLWNPKYQRWVDINGWEILQEKAKSRPNWLQFLEMSALQAGTRAPSLRLPPPEIKPTIPANEELSMAINLEYPNYQLLLFNRSEQGTVLHCPSFGYALNPIMDKPPIYLPQKDSWASKTEQKFIFKETGKEEFLAIVLEKPLNLDWLTPQKQDPLPKCNAERIQELFNQLEEQGNWHVFYQSFDVVEKQ